MIKLGSAFSGIGGFELGLHWAIPDLETVWQIEKDKFCQKVLKKHWPHSQIYDDITTINTKDLEDVDMLCAGFPCQDFSKAGKGAGIHGKKSGLFWELWRVLSEFGEQERQIPIVLLENVSAITNRGMGTVLGALSEIGYNAEWFTIRASDFGAPHIRERWFCICYVGNAQSRDAHRPVTVSSPKNKEQPRRTNLQNGVSTISDSKQSRSHRNRQNENRPKKGDKSKVLCKENRKTYPKDTFSFNTMGNATIPDHKRGQKHTMHAHPMGQKNMSECGGGQIDGLHKGEHWKKGAVESAVCSMDDGISNRVARIRALGNAIVPQCTYYIGKRMIETGLLRDKLCY